MGDKLETKIVILGIIPGLNGDDGLIRQNFRAAKKAKTKYAWIIASQTKNKHKGAVSITYIGYKSRLMDWDNFTASFKHLGDALVECKVITDDNPKIVQIFEPKQIKSRVAEQRAEIIIKDL